ncbi:hypothetical protein EVAR_53469_1 [Eumeta japonica]|uniref:Uncharacterized protein n=1 Tax=Eumeta variegata TaxID=151549 RepID=A0A4C1XTZ4_EUMVA|nr:hypothetical protein EVAR_53469_1 [Eumeta japonica]
MFSNLLLNEGEDRLRNDVAIFNNCTIVWSLRDCTRHARGFYNQRAVEITPTTFVVQIEGTRSRMFSTTSSARAGVVKDRRHQYGDSVRDRQLKCSPRHEACDPRVIGHAAMRWRHAIRCKRSTSPNTKAHLSSLRKAPKNGIGLHSGIASARPNARSYSADSRAADRKSSVGSGSSDMLNQKAFSLLDLRQ